MSACATAHCALQYSVASPPLYQSQPLCGVRWASQATTPSWARVRIARSGAGRAFRNQSAATIAALRTRMLTRDVSIPRDRALQPVAQRSARAEAEQLLRAGGIELATRLTVRHRRVPHELAFESRQLADQLRELANRGLYPRAEVHRFGAVVAVRREQQTLCRVVDVQELACRGPVAPQREAARRPGHL